MSPLDRFLLQAREDVSEDLRFAEPVPRRQNSVSWRDGTPASSSRSRVSLVEARSVYRSPDPIFRPASLSPACCSEKPEEEIDLASDPRGLSHTGSSRRMPTRRGPQGPAGGMWPSSELQSAL